MTEDLVIGSVPILGNLASLVLDYAFMRRVDDSARRVFQERWLRRRGKVSVIPPAEVSTRSQSLSVIWEATREILYLGSYGVGFVATLPVVATAQVARFLLPEPVVRGGADGARDAVAAGDRLHQGAHATGPLPASVSPRPAGAPA